MRNHSFPLSGILTRSFACASPGRTDMARVLDGAIGDCPRLDASALHGRPSRSGGSLQQSFHGSIGRGKAAAGHAGTCLAASAAVSTPPFFGPSPRKRGRSVLAIGSGGTPVPVPGLVASTDRVVHLQRSAGAGASRLACIGHWSNAWPSPSIAAGVAVRGDRVSALTATVAGTGCVSSGPEIRQTIKGVRLSRIDKRPMQGGGAMCLQSSPTRTVRPRKQMSILAKRGDESDREIMHRQRQDIVILETLEAAEDALHAGQVPAAMRLLRQGIHALDCYAQEGILLDRARRNGLDAPSVVRSLDEYRRRQSGDKTA